MKNQVTDHKGNVFESESALCRFYHLPLTTFKNRILRGWTLEEALTTDITKHTRKHPKKKYYDHLGNSYESITAMCNAYNIPRQVYHARVSNMKWPIERALTTPVCENPKNSIKIQDHLGNNFKSISEMCRYYHIGQNLYHIRLNAGWSLEKILTTPPKPINDMSAKTHIDHLGNVYESQNALCRAYNISKSMFATRIKAGWTLEDALTKPVQPPGIKIKDYLNREFPALKDLSKFYGLEKYSLQGLNGQNIEEMLKKRVINKFKNYQIDNLLVIKCEEWPYFLVKISKQEHIMHLEQILDIFHDSDNFDPSPCSIKIIKRLKFPFYLAELNNNQNQEFIINYWDMIKLDNKSNYGHNFKER